MELIKELTSEQERVKELNEWRQHPKLKMYLVKEKNERGKCIIKESATTTDANDIILQFQSSYGTFKVYLGRYEALLLSEGIKRLSQEKWVNSINERIDERPGLD